MTPPPPPPAPPLLLLPSDIDSLLPAPHELTPLSQSLIPPHLASAFLLPSPPPSNSPPHFLPFVASEPDADPPSLPSSSSTTPPPPNLHSSSWNVASAAAVAAHDHSSPAPPPPPPVPYDADSAADPPGYLSLTHSHNHSGGSDSNAVGWRGGKAASGKRMMPPMEMEMEEADSGGGGGGGENSGGAGDAAAARTLKRPRLVWTPQLHKRFVEAVGHLGIKSAVPKTIMQLMNVEGLTRENVASHLQKYRLYLKRMQGGGGAGGGAHAAGEGSSASDQLFASTPVPPSLVAAAHFLSAAGHSADEIPIPIPAPRTAHMAAASAFLHSNYDPLHHHQSLYPGFLRPPPPPPTHHPFYSADPHDCLIDAHAQPPPPPPPTSHKQVLTLFPSTGS